MGQLTLQQLKSHLWNCAEILRGSAGGDDGRAVGAGGREKRRAGGAGG
jgi:hypothetical protein